MEKNLKLNRDMLNYYLSTEFSLEATTLKLIDEITNYLFTHNHSREGYYYNGYKYYIPCYVYNLKAFLNNSDIYITFDEMIENKVLCEV